MRNIAFSLFAAAILLASACADRQQIPEAFIGTWQSDEAHTLASLNESESVTPADRDRFSDNFFGDRVIVFGAHEGKTYWVGDEWIGVEQQPEWLPYDVVTFGPDFVTLRYPATEYGEGGETTWRVDGDFIYAELPKWSFREYYRRIDD